MPGRIKTKDGADVSIYTETEVDNAIAAGAPVLEGAGNPNGVVTGNYGQRYRDTTSGINYVCVSPGGGTVWDVI